MKRSLLSRLLAMDRAEISFRVRSTARVHGGRVASRLRPPVWRRSDLSRVLSSAVLEPSLRDAIAREQWTDVNALLAEALRGRPARFVLDHHGRDSVRTAIASRWPGVADDARAAGDRILAGDYDLLGFRGLRFGDDVDSLDWHLDPVHQCRMPDGFWADVPFLDPRVGDHKLTWELNRHQHWLVLSRAAWLTGDERYGDRIAGELRAWLQANPPRGGANWASMLELGFRGLSWLWAMHALLAEPDSDRRGPWLIDLLIALDAQLAHVEHNLSYYFSPNTHLTGEALALYVTGVALPELARSAHWIDLGRRVLLTEIERQIGADGGHAERSTHYHRYTLDFYVLALLTARQAGDTEAAARFADAVSRMATFLRPMADAHGRTPQIGDDDGGMLWPLTGREPRDVRDSLATVAVLLGRPELAPWGITEETVWLTSSPLVDAAIPRDARRLARPGDVTATRAIDAHLFASTGYVTMATERGDHVVFDAGAHGYLNCGHAHADALALTIAIAGRPLLIDPGTVTYTMNPVLRDRFRSTEAHNTLTLDGTSSARPAGPFHWHTVADSRLLLCGAGPVIAWAEASHDGFAAGVHRRTIVHDRNGGWLILDSVDTRGPHVADRHWHFDRAWEVGAEGAGALRAVTPDGHVAWLLHDDARALLAHGRDGDGLGWCSPRYGAMEPAWVARTTRAATGRIVSVAWVGPAAGAAPRLERLVLPDGIDATGARVHHDGRVTTTLRIDGRGADSQGVALPDYHTDARLLQYSSGIADSSSLAGVQLTHALSAQDGLISLSADGAMADVALDCHGTTLTLWSSTPPPGLHVQAERLRRIETIMLNGREMSRRLSERRDTVTVYAADWGMPVSCLTIAGADGHEATGTAASDRRGAGVHPSVV